ncbi:MAG: 50S ribosomal protein L31e [archaeon]|nr:50S ribosomal protein L31e [archaeon]MCR4323367.1 50S ribosomal protein L31e [Nanoarchaeota archaeon]
MAEEKTTPEKKVEEKKEESQKKPEMKKETSKPAVEKSSKKKEEKTGIVELEREYIIPLKRGVLNVPHYRRAKKAISVIRKFLVKHMRVEGRDEKKIKIDTYLNQEIWFRGIKKPANKIKVKAIKRDGIVYVELVDIPDRIKFEKAREEERKLAAMPKKKEKKGEEPKSEEETKTEEEKTDEKEKEKSSVEAGFKRQEAAAKTQKHTSQGSHKAKTSPVRMSLKK